MNRNRILFFCLIVLSLVALLSAAVLRRQVDFMTRGVGSLTDTQITNPAHSGAELGLVVALEQYGDTELEQTLEQISTLGVRQIRQTFFYSSDFNWAEADRIFDAVAEQPPLEIVPLLDGDPADDYAPVPPDAFGAWSAAFAQRYAGQVDFYIIWDEPNITAHWGNGQINPQAYGAILSAAAQAIRQNDPTAQVVLAPLAPTTESNLVNMAEADYLQALYGAGGADSFDIVAVKPYGFDHSPLDRTTDPAVLNFNRPIMVREVMVRNGDGDKPVWAGNWGWNSLPADWSGEKSPWESVSAATQIDYTQVGLARAASEWPWMGTMFLHHWEPILQNERDPAVGYALANQADLSWLEALTAQDDQVATAGFYPASPDLPAAEWLGDWRFSPEFGADMSEKSDGENPDQVIFRFNGTDVALKVRRANFRARFNILIDGEPANALPQDERTAEFGSALVLNTNSPDEDQIEIIPVATGLTDGEHEMIVTGFRGWDQWALKGFVVTNRPDVLALQRLANGLLGLAVAFGLGALALFRPAQIGRFLLNLLPASLSQQGYLWLTSAAAGIVSLTGWLTWGEGVFRRFGDGSQIAILFGTAIVFYVTPWLPVYLLALVLLFVLIYQRPILGLALITFSIPFYVPQLLKPIYSYRFSPVETFTLLTAGAVALRQTFGWLTALAEARRMNPASNTRNMINHVRPSTADWGVFLLFLVACLSLPFTERLGVATNELRTVIIGPTLFYWMLRKTDLSNRDIWWLLVAFVSSGLLVAIIGLGQYVSGANLITAEGGLQRLRSIYGSPNNVALYLGRIYPLLLALLLARFLRDGFSLRTARSNGIELVALAVILCAILLSFSRGGVLLGLPLSTAAVLILLQKRRNRPVWPWLTAGIGLIIVGYFSALQVPSLAGRLTLSGQTAGFRINLWRSSWQMIKDRPLFGVGLDNFLYAYRNRYILAQAWQEPNLNHPHNIVFDFATRLGIFGLIAGGAVFWGAFKNIFAKKVEEQNTAGWGLQAGLAGAIFYILGHGLVDHSFFLVDLAYSTYFLLALSSINLETFSFYRSES